MKTKKRHHDEDENFFGTSKLPVHIFRAGDVSTILGMEKWRLEKFLTGKQYHLSPSGHIGKGAGSWRLFSHQDVYRLGIADLLVKDGFTAKFVSFVLENIEDRELLERDMTGEAAPPDLGIFRTDGGPELKFLSRGSIDQKQGPYYVIRLSDLLREIDQRISQLIKERNTPERS